MTAPGKSALTGFEIVEDGERIIFRFVHDDRPETLVSLDYQQQRQALAIMLSGLVQTFGIRREHNKPATTEGPPAACMPMPVVEFQLNIAEDGSHAILGFVLPNHLSIQFVMEAITLKNVARKILSDFESFAPPATH